MMQRVGDGAHGAIGRRPDDRRTEVEIHLDDELRQPFELRELIGRGGSAPGLSRM